MTEALNSTTLYLFGERYYQFAYILTNLLNSSVRPVSLDSLQAFEVSLDETSREKLQRQGWLSQFEYKKLSNKRRS